MSTPSKKSTKATKTTKPNASVKAPEEDTSFALALPMVSDPAAFFAQQAHLLAEVDPKSRKKISVRQLTADAQRLLKLATPHRALLVAAGLEAKYIDELPMRVAIARAAQAVRQLSTGNRSERELKVIARAEAHRAEMIRVARYALRKVPAAQETLSGIQVGSGTADLVQDEHDLAAFFKEHAEALTAVDVDPVAMAREAVRLADEVTNLVADRKNRVTGGTPEVIDRNKAVTFALEALREVRDCLAYRFPKDVKLQASLAKIGVTPDGATSDVEDDEDLVEEPEEQAPVE